MFWLSGLGWAACTIKCEPLKVRQFKKTTGYQREVFPIPTFNRNFLQEICISPWFFSSFSIYKRFWKKSTFYRKVNVRSFYFWICNRLKFPFFPGFENKGLFLKESRRLFKEEYIFFKFLRNVKNSFFLYGNFAVVLFK